MRTFTDRNGVIYRQIYKKEARKLYNEGKDIVCCACNLRPFGMFGLECVISQQYYLDWTEDSFDKAVNSFEFYNCTDSYTGRYASYYVAA